MRLISVTLGLLGLSAVLMSSIGAGRIAPKLVDEAAFRDSLKRSIAGKVKGYAFVIANRSGIVATASGGWAQAPHDGGVPMKTDIPADVGSVAKVASGVALLDLLETNLAPGQSVDQKLDDPLRFYVPDKWNKAYFQNRPSDLAVYVRSVNRITLRLLLNHRSGLKDFDDGGSHGTKVARALDAGPNPLRIGRGSVSYLNENISLLLYIIPRIAYPAEVDAIERRNADKSLRDYNVSIAREYGALYERYMREKFFPRTLAPIAPTCHPGEDVPNGRYAKEYESRSDRRGYTGLADFCRAQGSWYYSAKDLARLARTIEFSNRFIENSTRKLLYDPIWPQKRLIFHRLESHNILKRDRGGGGQYRTHGGTSGFGTIAALIRLPFGYVGVAIANSPEFNSAAISDILLDAFAAATRDWTEWNTDRPGDNINSILIIPDPAICRQRCDATPSCKAWTYVKLGIQHPERARCWLKSKTSVPRRSACCNSGVKGVEYGYDRPGSNIQNFVVGRNDPALCQVACGFDPNCKAWTFVKPGGQGDRPVCWLKHRAAPKRKSDCCASGLSPR